MELDKRLEDLFDEDTLMEPEKSSSPPKPVRKEASKKNPDQIGRASCRERVLVVV